MSCVSPFRVPNTNYLVPCGRCMQCRIARQSALTFLCERELIHDVYPKGLGASFVTLTYNEDNLPFVKGDKIERFSKVSYNRSASQWTETLYKKDLQDFFKRCRRSMEYHGLDIPFRHISCGEYGDTTYRSHYHIVFLGLSDCLAKKVVAKNWRYGLVDVGPLSAGGLRYVVKYCTKKYDSSTATLLQESCGVTPPFLIHSQHLGKNWIDSHLNSIIDNNFTFVSATGHRSLYPKCVRQYVEKRTGVSSLPYIQSYIAKDMATCPSDQDYTDFCRERNILREQYLIASARSRGVSVTPEFLSSRKWLRPVTSRINPNLIDSAYYDDEIPF